MTQTTTDRERAREIAEGVVRAHYRLPPGWPIGAGSDADRLVSAINDALLSFAPSSDNYVLPCDVHLPPATIIRKGCTLKTLMTALNVRERNPDMQHAAFDPVKAAALTRLVPSDPSPDEIIEACAKVADSAADNPIWAAQYKQANVARDLALAIGDTIRALKGKPIPSKADGGETKEGHVVDCTTMPPSPVSGEGEPWGWHFWYLDERMGGHSTRTIQGDKLPAWALNDKDHPAVRLYSIAPSRPPEPAVSGEAVAWRITFLKDGWTTTTDHETYVQAVRDAGNIITVEPLYTHPPEGDVRKLREAAQPFAELVAKYEAAETQRRQHHKDEGRPAGPPLPDSHMVSAPLGDCRTLARALSALPVPDDETKRLRDGGPRKIYVASSWRCADHPRVVQLLRDAGHEVYDFRNPAPGNTGFAWSTIDPNWLGWEPQAFADLLQHPVAQAGFALDKAALDWCDTCVLVLPCGRSAHLEAGYTAGQGKETLFYLSPDRFEPELMYLLGDGCVTTDDALLRALASPKPPVEGR